MIEGLEQPRPDGAAVIGAQGYARDFEPGAVMPLDKPHQVMGYRMVAEIRGNIGDAYPVMTVGAGAGALATLRTHVLEINLRTAQLQRRIGAITQQDEGRRHRCAVPHSRGEPVR